MVGNTILPFSHRPNELIARKGPMNKLRLVFAAGTALVMSLGTATMAQAQYYPPPGYYHHHHHWYVGDRYYGPRHIIVHWRHFRLPRPPYGYVWVQYGPQFLLIGPNGVISRVW
jgi:Ni/Co efflux regulator RcnB